MLQKADEAIYARRNTAVELERGIKENELNTEIAIEEKRRTVRETQIRADIAIEQERATLVDSKVENDRKESQARADGLRAMLDPMKEVDWRHTYGGPIWRTRRTSIDRPGVSRPGRQGGEHR